MFEDVVLNEDNIKAQCHAQCIYTKKQKIKLFLTGLFSL